MLSSSSWVFFWGGGFRQVLLCSSCWPWTCYLPRHWGSQAYTTMLALILFHNKSFCTVKNAFLLVFEWLSSYLNCPRLANIIEIKCLWFLSYAPMVISFAVWSGFHLSGLLRRSPVPLRQEMDVKVINKVFNLKRPFKNVEGEGNVNSVLIPGLFSASPCSNLWL